MLSALIKRVATSCLGLTNTTTTHTHTNIIISINDFGSLQCYYSFSNSLTVSPRLSPPGDLPLARCCGDLAPSRSSPPHKAIEKRLFPLPLGNRKAKHRTRV